MYLGLNEIKQKKGFCRKKWMKKSEFFIRTDVQICKRKKYAMVLLVWNKRLYFFRKAKENRILVWIINQIFKFVETVKSTIVDLHCTHKVMAYSSKDIIGFIYSVIIYYSQVLFLRNLESANTKTVNLSLFKLY